MSKLKYIYPGLSELALPSDGTDIKSVSGDKIQEGLINLTNRNDARDMYGNRVVTEGEVRDMQAIGSPLDPSEFENPESGFFAGSGVIHCDTCGVDTDILELAKPSHLGHNLIYADSKKNYDVSAESTRAQRGGGYEIGPMVEPNEAARAPKPLESGDVLSVSDPEATPNFLEEAADRTVAM